MEYIKRIVILFSIVIIIATFIYACAKREGSTIIAEIDGKPIYSEELNSIIKQEIFDELYRIYELKRKALDQLVVSLL